MKVAVLGYGTIGSGVVEVLKNNAALITAQAGEDISVKYVLDLREFPGDPVEEILVHDVNTILDDPEIELVVETMGGTGAAYKFVKAALEAGKHAATSNKALVAKYGSELLDIARKHGTNFQFEASVGGGIPIIRAMYTSMLGNNILGINGILNGTTNFMLTKMDRENRDYDDVLKEAQALGYAERDPSADVEGFDTCRKIAILASIATGKFVDFEDVPTRGITDIAKEDMEAAKALGYSIKLLGTFKKDGEKVYASVTPALVDPSSALYPVSDVFNAVLVDGDMSSELMFYGSGAGKLPTASAVVADVIEITKNKDHTVFAGWGFEKQELSDASSEEKCFFVRTESDAFITEKMTEKAVRARYSDAAQIIPVA
ncbi:MAG: homoserine dehydrogenase [Lachnospiraceae bacterium]|nr:homoserine dehydrogenase [Lachnospiraceae bacterium]